MILLTGGNGQLGTELRHYLDEKKVSYHSTDAQEMDITDRAATMALVKKIQPDVIYHCAAYTAVDNAEDEGKQLNEKVNVGGTKNVALAAKSVGARLVYLSTDYVFDGAKESGEYSEEDPLNPQNEYGRTKLLGEQSIKEILDDYYIIRTSWVYGEYGNNFVYTMQRLAKEREFLTVVADQFGRPTWTRSLVEFMVYLVDSRQPYGTYQFSNDGSCSWYEFAKEILKETSTEVRSVTSDEFPQKATRPKYSIMSLSKAKSTGFVIDSWQTALEKFKKSIN